MHIPVSYLVHCYAHTHNKKIELQVPVFMPAASFRRFKWEIFNHSTHAHAARVMYLCTPYSTFRVLSMAPGHRHGQGGGTAAQPAPARARTKRETGELISSSDGSRRDHRQRPRPNGSSLIDVLLLYRGHTQLRLARQQWPSFNRRQSLWSVATEKKRDANSKSSSTATPWTHAKRVRRAALLSPTHRGQACTKRGATNLSSRHTTTVGTQAHTERETETETLSDRHRPP